MITTTTPNTAADLQALVAAGELRELHTSSERGYVSRKSTGYVQSYKGKFGTGYKLLTPRFDTTQYCDVTYFVA